MSMTTVLLILVSAAFFGLVCGIAYHFVPSTGWLAYGAKWTPVKFGLWMAVAPAVVALTVYFGVSAMR